jgi:hypothetical protein
MKRHRNSLIARVLAVAAGLGAACGAASAANPPPFNANSPITIGGATTTAGQAIGASSSGVWRNIATRVNYPNLAPSDGFRNSVTSRLYFPLATRGQISAIRVCYGDFGFNGTQTYEQNATYPLTITASVEFNTSTPAGVWFPGGTGATHQIPLSFHGGSSASLSVGGAPVCSEPLYYPFVSPQSLYVWTYVSSTGGWVANNGTRNAYHETVNDGAFNVNSASLASATTQTFTISPTSTTSVSLLPIVGAFAITGPGITGTATATCSGGTSTITGTGISSGSLNA